MISIVTSVLNGIATLPRCITSVAKQTIPCEHIIVDAGSTDGSRQLVLDSNNSRIQLVDAPGTNISEAFNLGIQKSCGDFIGILNADDWYEPDAVERSIQGLYDDPDAGFSFGSVVVHMGDYKLLYQPKMITGDLRDHGVRQMMFNHISSFVRRTVYEHYGMYNPSYSVAMDYDFYARIISAGVRGVYVPGILGHVTGGGKSSDLLDRAKDYLRISSRYHGVFTTLLMVAKFTLKSWFFSNIIANSHTRAIFNPLLRGRIRIHDNFESS